jgi:hypothetical protein
MADEKGDITRLSQRKAPVQLRHFINYRSPATVLREVRQPEVGLVRNEQHLPSLGEALQVAEQGLYNLLGVGIRCDCNYVDAEPIEFCPDLFKEQL